MGRGTLGEVLGNKDGGKGGGLVRDLLWQLGA